MLECLLCLERYGREDVRSGLYRLETFVCSRCYRKMQAKPHAASCFGKPTFVAEGKVLRGYSEKAEVCQTVCPDREVCRKVVQGIVNG